MSLLETSKWRQPIKVAESSSVLAAAASARRQHVLGNIRLEVVVDNRWGGTVVNTSCRNCMRSVSRQHVRVVTSRRVRTFTNTQCRAKFKIYEIETGNKRRKKKQRGKLTRETWRKIHTTSLTQLASARASAER
jgi:hypothetical protein